MSEPSLFENEQQVITEAETFLSQTEKPADETYTRFNKLIKSYKKFLRHFSRVVKINDRQQTQLRKQEEELRAEIEKRSEIEFKLRENEKQLVHARDLAEQALEDRARFFASMSHEIRTPLNGVIGSANLLQTSQLTREQNEFINTIIASSKILLVVINDILDFSKIESGKLQLESLPIHLESMVEEVFDIMAISALSKGLEILFSCNIPNYHQISFSGDLTRISQVLINLLNNAIKFTHEGMITLKIQAIQDELGNPFLQFSIQDTGIGIPESRFSQLFQAFSQAKLSTTRKYGGTGLGLSICNHLSTLWGGKIWVESVEGEGSTFSFTLPFQEVEERKEEIYYPELEEKHLLILDPNQQVLHQLQRVLDLQKINYHLASNLEDALSAIKTQPPFDLIMINHSFTDQTAKQILQKVNLNLNTEIPSLILIPPGLKLDKDPTGDTPTATLAKPYKRQQLFSILHSVFQGYSLEEKESPVQIHPNLYQRFPMQILVAEDNQINQVIATATFKQLGYQITMVSNGKEAMDKALATKFDLIFMDVQMPVMDGFEASRQITAQMNSANPPIIAITANATPGDRQDCLTAGMSDFLSKPLLIKDLIQMINKWGESLGIEASKDIESDAPSTTLKAGEPAQINGKLSPQMFNLAMIETLKTNYSNELLKEIASHYVDELANSMNLVEEQLTNSEWQQLKKTSHKIRGSSLNLGVDSIAQLYAVIEAAATDKDHTTIQKAIEQIRQLHQPVCLGIQHLTD